MNYIYLLFLPYALGFKYVNTKFFKTSLNSINPIQYKNILKQKSLGKLIVDIDNNDVEKIFFSNDLKTSYARYDVNGDGEYDLEDYSVVTTDPYIANVVIEHANKNKVETTILEPYINPFQSLLSGVYSIFDAIFVPTIIFLVIRSIFLSITRGNMPMGPNSNIGGNNFSPFNSKMKNDDKLNMIKANISLSSWAGSPEIFQECTEIVSYLNNRTLYQAAGADIPKGILLEGPPGTGKTLLAKAIASECDANFISIASSEFVELFVGMGAAKVRNLFAKARENTPCIIFIDEIDAVGKQRGTGVNVGNDEREQTLNQILAEMDGFAQNDNVLIIAATNRRDVLDSALLRPGRFDRIINVPLPDTESRKAILNVHLQNKTIDESVDLEKYAELTAGYSGAELKNLINEAAIFAVRQMKTVISDKNMQDSLEKLTVGIIKQNDTRSEESIMRVAHHEMGHAFLAASFSEYFNLKKISIQSTYNGAGGYTIFGEHSNITESGLYTKDMLKKRIIVALGGKAAEYVFYGDKHISLGASQDLKQANSIAKQMIGTYGMGETLKTFYNENTDSGRTPFLGRSLASSDGVYSEYIKETFDNEVRQIVDEAYKEAVNIIHNNQNKINVLSNILINTKTMDGSFLNGYTKHEYVDEKSDLFEE
jgi:cell division protease FtsH